MLQRESVAPGKREYRVRFDEQGRIQGASLHDTLGQQLGIAVRNGHDDDIRTYVHRLSHLEPELPLRLERRIQKLIAHQEEFALTGDFTLDARNYHLHLSGRCVGLLNGEREYTFLILDDTAPTQLRRLYEYMFRLANHEIKSPLACVIGATEYAEEDLSAGRLDGVRTCLEMIDRNAHAIDEMLTRYLNLSRLESGIITPNPCAVVLSEDVIYPIQQEMKSTLRKRGQQVLYTFDKFQEEPTLEADPEMLIIVLRNLLSNASKYGNANSVIRVVLSQGNECFCISVENEGPNIPKENMDRLFRKFMRLDDTRGTKGSGLGLYNSRKVVELFGGKIWVESDEHTTRFSFTVPVE